MKLEQMKTKMLEMQIFAKQKTSALDDLEQDRQRLQIMVDSNKKRSMEYEHALIEKDKQVSELSNSNKILETFKSVLNHNLTELSTERGPMNEYIADLKTYIASIYEELVEEFELKKVEKELADKREKKILDLGVELTRFRAEAKKNQQLTQSFMRDLSNVFSSISVDAKGLEDEVRKLYKRYVKNEKVDFDLKSDPVITAMIKTNIQGDNHGGNDDDEDSVDYSTNNYNIGNNGNSNNNGNNMSKTTSYGKKAVTNMNKMDVDKALLDAATETEKQKQFLENELDFLKKKITQNDQNNNILQRKRVKENSQLLFEVNDLRQQVKHLERRLQQTSSELVVTKRLTSSQQRNISSASSGGTTSKSKLKLNKSTDLEATLNDDSDDEDEYKTNPNHDPFHESVPLANIILENTLPGRNLKTVTRTRLNEQLKFKTGPSPTEIQLQIKEQEISKLSTDVHKLTVDLEESYREREMQRKEIARIRKLLVTNQGVVLNSPAYHANSPSISLYSGTVSASASIISTHSNDGEGYRTSLSKTLNALSPSVSVAPSPKKTLRSQNSMSSILSNNNNNNNNDSNIVPKPKIRSGTTSIKTKNSSSKLTLENPHSLSIDATKITSPIENGNNLNNNVQDDISTITAAILSSVNLAIDTSAGIHQVQEDMNDDVVLSGRLAQQAGTDGDSNSVTSSSSVKNVVQPFVLPKNPIVSSAHVITLHQTNSSRASTGRE